MIHQLTIQPHKNIGLNVCDFELFKVLTGDRLDPLLNYLYHYSFSLWKLSTEGYKLTMDIWSPENKSINSDLSLTIQEKNKPNINILMKMYPQKAFEEHEIKVLDYKTDDVMDFLRTKEKWAAE